MNSREMGRVFKKEGDQSLFCYRLLVIKRVNFNLNVFSILMGCMYELHVIKIDLCI